MPSQAEGERGRRDHVHVVSEAEAAACSFKATRVVLPLPGANAQYPQDELGAVYRSLLAHDGVDPYEAVLELAATSAQDCDNQVLLLGDYRPLLLRPRRLEWTLLRGAASQQDGGALDMLISFDLRPGAYATMALREIIKPEAPPSQRQHIRFDTDQENPAA